MADTLSLGQPEGKNRSIWRGPTWADQGRLIKNQYGKENLAVNSRTRWRTFRAAATFLMSSNTSLIMSAMDAISGSFMPRVVTAGAPRRIPLAWQGERGSKGMVFSFTVMLASSRACWQSFHVHPWDPNRT